MAAPKNKIVFLKQGSFSHINRNVEKFLRARFPEYMLDVIDVGDLLKQNRIMMAANIPWFIREYGLSLNNSLAQHRKNFYRTTFLFLQLKKLVNRIVSQRDYIFSFQTQSLFDLSTDGVPHYVYTDHAILSNLAYPNITPAYIDAHYPPRLVELERTIYQNATTTFTMGGFVAQTLIERYGCEPANVVSVGGGSNLPCTPTIDKKYPHPSRYAAKNILFLGVVWERKGGAELVAAFTEARKNHPTATLTIVGCTPSVTVEGCTIVGPVPLDSVRSYYEQASIFCMPSHREPFGLAYVEAFMNKLPVVATTVGAIPDIVKHDESGLLVGPGDHAGLCRAIDRLLDDPDLCRRYGEKGYEFVRPRYTWDAVGAAIADQITATYPF